MSDLPPKSPKWGTLGEEPGISKPPASGGWGVKIQGDLKRRTGYFQAPRIGGVGGKIE
jgi:hypothetical protein